MKMQIKYTNSYQFIEIHVTNSLLAQINDQTFVGRRQRLYLLSTQLPMLNDDSDTIIIIGMLRISQTIHENSLKRFELSFQSAKIFKSFKSNYIQKWLICLKVTFHCNHQIFEENKMHKTLKIQISLCQNQRNSHRKMINQPSNT